MVAFSESVSSLVSSEQGLDVDFSLPRRDNKVGSGHRGFRIETDPTMSFHDAALRRDLTVNSMGFDPETHKRSSTRMMDAPT